MRETQYFEIVAQSGRAMREDKPGFINPDLSPILSRIGAKPEAWIDTISNFGTKFRLAAGRNSSLKKFADKLGVHWLVGIIYAHAVFL